jgi:hypothetical protein
VADELAKQLKKVNKGLSFLFGPVVDGRREFIISADGIRERFPAVKTLVSAAPDIPGWKIIAFRPPVQDISDLTLMLGDTEVSANDIWFAVQQSGPNFDLEIFLNIPPTSNRDTVTGAAFLILDHTVGEYNVETRFGSITIKDLPTNPASAGLRAG